MQFSLHWELPFVHVEEEEIIDDARQFLPPSFFDESANNQYFQAPFVEPPSHHPPHSAPTHFGAPLSPPRVKSLPPPLMQPATKQNPLIPSTSISRSPSSETTSTQAESAITDDEPILSPITRGLDRPRLHRSIPDNIRDPYISRGGFRRIPGVASPESPSTTFEKSSQGYSPGTLRRIRALPSDQFRIATRGLQFGGPRRAASAEGDLNFMRNGRPIHASSSDEKPAQKTPGMASREASTPQAAQKRQGTD